MEGGWDAIWRHGASRIMQFLHLLPLLRSFHPVLHLHLSFLVSRLSPRYPFLFISTYLLIFYFSLCTHMIFLSSSLTQSFMFDEHKKRKWWKERETSPVLPCSPSFHVFLFIIGDFLYSSQGKVLSILYPFLSFPSTSLYLSLLTLERKRHSYTWRMLKRGSQGEEKEYRGIARIAVLRLQFTRRSQYVIYIIVQLELAFGFLSSDEGWW